MRRQPRPILVALVLAAALASQAATCGHRPRYNTAVTLDGLVDALRAVQTAEIALYQMRPCSAITGPPCITPADHVRVQSGLRQAFTLIDDAAHVVLAWQPGQPMPLKVAGIIAAAEAAVNDLMPLLPMDAGIRDSVMATYRAIAAVARMFAGGGA